MKKLMVRKIISGITLLISILLLTVSCNQHIKKSVFKTKDGKGYVYQDTDDLLWYYIVYNQSNGMYEVSPVNGTPDFDASSSVSLDLSSANTSDFASVSESMSETTGESGEASADNDASGEGMSESTGESGDGGGESTGTSDAGSDGGGSDGGGGGE